MSEIVSHIVLTGICLLVRPQADASKPPEAAVFMDGRTDRFGKDLVPAHHVYLVVEDSLYTVEVNSYIDPRRGDPVTVERVPGGGGKYYDVILLDDKMIRVISDTKESSVAEPPGSLDSVPHLAKVWPRMMGGAHKAATALHQPKRDPALSYRVNSRLALERGTLGVKYDSGDQWQFDPGVPFHRKLVGSIPQEVTFDSTIPSSVLDLQIRDIVKDTVEAVLTIRSRDGTARDITVLLANVPRADLFPTDECPDVDCSANPDHICCKDHHFALYYNAFDRPPRNPPVPHKTLLVTSSGTIDSVKLFRAGGANCGPSQQP